jgi:hypothetical protein
MIYKFYHTHITEHGTEPVGDVKATLVLEGQNDPVWRDMAEDFESLCLPWFEEPTRFDIADSLVDIEPYSEEALRYMAEVKLPTFGFTMLEVSR